MKERQKHLQAWLVAGLIFGVGSSPCVACPGPVTYKTVIGEHDLKSSSGQNLNTLGAFVRQDRANFHKFRLRDAGDEPDAVLSDEKKRAELEQAVNRAYPDFSVDPFYWDAEFGTILSVTFWHCDSPQRASVEELGIAKPSDPHPRFDRNSDEDRERKLDRLPPPPGAKPDQSSQNTQVTPPERSTRPQASVAARREPLLGWSWDHGSRAGAEGKALKACPGSCEIVLWFHNACGAIAVGTTGGRGWGWNKSKARAGEVALSNCKKNDEACELKNVVCSPNGFGAIAIGNSE